MLAEALVLLSAGTVLVVAMMAILWWVHLKIRDAGIVDIGWAAGLGLLALLYAVAGSGDPFRRATIGLMGAMWSSRLAFHLYLRMRGRPEEGRYQALRREWQAAGHNVPARFFWFFQFQAMLDVVLSLPFLLPCLNPRPGLSAVELSAVVLFAVAVTGESIADQQLETFKADPENRGKVCDAGLWRFSRHPNYFFEWLIWCALALFALGSPWGVAGVLSPALILFFLLRVTGIPATEAQALRTKGDLYRQYQERTSAFVPWFPRKPKG